jgi:hypothetical protein
MKIEGQHHQNLFISLKRPPIDKQPQDVRPRVMTANIGCSLGCEYRLP